MREQKYGRIVNISSIGGKIKNPMWPVYSGLKAGIAHFTRSTSDVLARDGITINCVGPGLINDEATIRALTEEGTAGMAAIIPVGRIGEFEDINRAVLFMADEEAGFITGQELTVCGGQSPY
jgi:acetoacetyl-CoA reductase